MLHGGTNVVTSSLADKTILQRHFEPQRRGNGAGGEEMEIGMPRGHEGRSPPGAGAQGLLQAFDCRDGPRFHEAVMLRRTFRLYWASRVASSVECCDAAYRRQKGRRGVFFGARIRPC
jgi:hypothetical protein